MADLNDTHSDNRKATWLELFFDLIFVVAIAKAAHVVQHQHHGHIDVATYLKYALIMIPIWWAWVGATLYANRFDCDDIWQRLMSFGQMFCVVILAAHISTDFDSYYKGFLLSYAGIRLITILMYLRASLTSAQTKAVSNFLALSFTVGILISLSSLFFEGPLRYILLYAGIGFDMIMPLIGHKRLKAMPVHAHHLPERFGLLTIILLGESVLSLATSFGMLEWTTPSLIMAGCGFAVACGLWWIYFNSIERGVVGRNLGHGQNIIYSHLLIYSGLGAVAAVIHFAVIPELTLLDYKILSAVGILGFMVGLQFLHMSYNQGSERKSALINAALFNVSFIAMLVLAPTIFIVMVGTTTLVLAYAALDHHRLK